ncbi:MAG: hypothetical protein K8R60_04505 [Burkholderiales bacterium]|nr:hypothetical protein [Burkholderiales bacterium]
MTYADELVQLVALCRQCRAPAVVAIDGFSGAGKTTLAQHLAEATSGRCVDLDDLVPDTPPTVPSYADLIDAADLRRRIAACGAAITFVSGVCLRDVLDAAGVAVALRIYVKRLSEVGLWHDGLNLEDVESGAAMPSHWLGACDLAYHSRQRPHERSDFVIERVEGRGPAPQRGGCAPPA